MSRRKHSPAPFVAFTEQVTERIQGFEVCTVMETDAEHHPKLLAIVKRRADAELFEAAPEFRRQLIDARRVIEQVLFSEENLDPQTRKSLREIIERKLP